MTDIKQDLSYSGYFDYVFDVRMVAPIKRLTGADFSRIGHVPGGTGNMQGQYPTVGHISYGTDEQAWRKAICIRGIISITTFPNAYHKCTIRL
mgnify:CR=1 FL=1